MSQTETLSSRERRKEIESQVRAIVDRFAHRAVIVESDLNNWIDHVVGTYGDLATWHAARAGGFGGSQIGALVRNFMGQRADHSASAHDIVEGALFRRVPDEPNGHMRRGIAMESEHRNWFYRRYGARRDAEGFKVLSGSFGPRRWMRYSPDELAFMRDPRSMNSVEGRWLGDYKAPSEIHPISFQYVCQLHMGRMVCEHNGIHVDGMILSQFDWRSWDLHDDVVDLNPELNDLIIEAGDHYWAYVERGEVPPYVRKNRLEDADSLASDLSQQARSYAHLAAMSSALSDCADVIKESILQRVAMRRFGSAKLSIDGNLTISASPVFDSDRVRELLPDEAIASIPLRKPASGAYDKDLLLARVRETMAKGERMSQFLAPGNFEPDALYEALVNAGVDVDSIMQEQFRMAISPEIKSEARAHILREYTGLIGEGGGEFESGRDGEGDARHAPRPVCA